MRRKSLTFESRQNSLENLVCAQKCKELARRYRLERKAVYN